MKLPAPTLLALAFSVAGPISPALGQAFSQDEIACTMGISEAVQRTIVRQAKVNRQCLRRAGSGLEANRLSGCIAEDRSAERVDRFVERITAKTLAACSPDFPAVGPSEPSAALDAARLGTVRMLGDLFGEPLDDSVVSCAANQEACHCQRRVTRYAYERFEFTIESIALCQEEAMRQGAISEAEMGVCLSTGANDPTSPVGLESAHADTRAARRSARRLEGAVSHICENRGVTSVAFAGSCSTAPEGGLFGCVDTAIRCRACRTVGSMGGTTSDCDVFDDGVRDGSCAECGGVGQACCAGASCTGSLSCCGGFCRDTEVDVNHCGACDSSCDDSVFCDGVETCSFGSCISLGDPCPATDCLHTCDEVTQTCYDPIGTACGVKGEYCHPLGSCAVPICGDGIAITAAGEECDSAGESATCDADCTVAECGDGVKNFTAGESCDDAGESATCDPDCTVARCGDGFLNLAADENCDPGQETSVCNRNCTFSECGDGTTNPVAHEQCDDGEATDRCDEDCTYAECGDGVTNQQAGEECDEGGATATCNADCTLAGCGDGTVQQGEECDTGGESATCDSDCTAARCGDGTVNNHAGEDCDDGEATAFCTETCGLVADERISVALDGDAVVITGTPRGETVIVSCDGTNVVVSYTELAENHEHSFSWSAVGRIVFQGGMGNDILTGTSCNLPIYADGGGGDDELHGGTAADVLEGGLGLDHLYGYDGDDILCGYLEFDDPVGNDPYLLCDTQTEDKPSYILGEEGDDTIGGSNHLELAANVISGGRGKDKIAGGWNSHSEIFGGDGDDRIWGGFANDTIRGGKDDDTIFAWAGDDSVWGDGCDGSVLEVLCGTKDGKGQDDIDGGEGDDDLRGGDSNDKINGGPGEDTIYGGGGDDELHGGEDDDELHGNNGQDEIHGGKGDDELWGGAEVDKLIGAPSGEGSSDKDLCVGGAGSDIYTRCDCQAFQEFFGSDTCN